jgi:hypothetical protein
MEVLTLENCCVILQIRVKKTTGFFSKNNFGKYL